MKKFYSIILVAFCFAAQSQIISIPDPIFKAELLAASPDNYTAVGTNGDGITIDTNGDGEIQVSEALTVYRLNLVEPSTNLTGIQSFSNLQQLDAGYLALESLDVSNMVNLVTLYVTENFLTSLNVNGCTSLYSLQCDFNELTTLTLSGLPALNDVMCGSNNIHTLDVSGLSSLTFLSAPLNDMTSLNVSGCSNLDFLQIAFNSLTSLDLSGCHPSEVDMQENFVTHLNIKNGFDDSEAYIDFFNNPVEYICADEVEIASYETSLLLNGINDGEVNSYCSFTPGGNYYTIQGINRFNSDNVDCTVTDPFYPGLKFSIASNNAIIGTYIADNSGNYSISVPFGEYTITPVLENPAFFSVSPASIFVPFPSPANPIDQNFCIIPNGIHPDLEVGFIPLTASVPGFDPEYRIVYHNKGNQTQSGTVSLDFQASVLSVVDSTPPAVQTGNVLTWAFADLLPSQTRIIDIKMHLNAPTDTPPVSIDEELNFIASISGGPTDEMPEDNTAVHQEKVVGSFDPNDKTCLEGTMVSPEVIGDYVHYLIRFENTGTYPATNVVVRDAIDLSKFDIATLQPVGGSHPFVTRVSDDIAEFIFENINLPFDDANNDGYVAFKIKTNTTLSVGDSFSNSAGIYFDYNLPVITNTYTSTVQALATTDFEFEHYITVAPNPTESYLNLNTRTDIQLKSMMIYDMVGRLVMAVPAAETIERLDVSHLQSGSYFLKVNTDKGMATTKFVKQ